MVQPYEHFCTSIKIVMAMPELTQKNVQDTLCEKKAGYESVWIDYNTYA